MQLYYLVLGLLAASVQGHMQMSNPYPIRSPLNPKGGSNKDYSYTSPLDASGSNYPCKGYQNDPFVSVAEYTAGSSYPLQLAGSATHGGGSCQVSLSYDKAKTFQVIKSMEGGCPLTSSYQFTIPSDAPSGQALLVWSWFNKIGNREMYMNCAQVTIKGGSSKRSHPRDLVHDVARSSSSFDSLPPLFIANVNGPGGCTTTANEEVKFPLPGSDVQGTVSGPGYTCSGSAAFLGSGSSNSSSSSSGSASSGSGSSAPSSSSSTSTTSAVASSTAAPAPAAGSQSAVPSPASSSAPAQASPSTGTSETSPAAAPVPSSTPAGGQQGSCTSGQIVCGAGGNSFSICDNGALVNMGSVAAGTQCQNGAIVRR